MTRVMDEQGLIEHQTRMARHRLRIQGPTGELVDTDAPAATCTRQSTLLELRQVSLELPMPPSVNALYGVGRNGQKFLMPEQRQFRSEVISLSRIQQARAMLAGRLEVTISLHFADRRRSDIDNRVKSALDALTHARVYHDDSQVDALLVYRIIEDNSERCVVRVKEIG